MADALSDAKAALGGAEKKFPGSMAKAAGVAPASERRTMPTVSAPKIASPASSAPAGGLGAELGNKASNVKQYTDAVPKMHKGGTMGETEPVVLKKDETVRTKKQEQAVQDKLKGTKASELMTKDEPKKEGKKDEKPGKKKKHPFKRTIIEHHTDGQSHTMTHEHESGDPTQNVTSAKESLQGVHDGLEENIGGPAEPPQAPAGQPPVAAAGAAPAVAAPGTQGV